MVVISTIPPKKLSTNAYVSVRKNNAAKDPLIITGLILVTSKNNATGMPPSNEKPFTVPAIKPVEIFA